MNVSDHRVEPPRPPRATRATRPDLGGFHEGRDGGANRGGNHRGAKLTDAQRAEVRAAPPELGHAELGRRYGVSETTIRRLRARRWLDTPG